MALGRWGALSPSLLQGFPLSIDALVLSFRTMFSSNAAHGLDATIELRIGDEPFRAKLANGELQLTREKPEWPDAIIEASAETLVAVVTADANSPRR
jgi:hypothetical protein